MRGATIGSLGILVTLAEIQAKQDGDFHRRLCLKGEELGMDVFLFAPETIDWRRGTVHALRYRRETGDWEGQPSPLPDLVYDRCFPANRRQRESYLAASRRLRQCPGVRLLGNRLGGKWSVGGWLSRFPGIAPHLVATDRLADPQALRHRLEREESVFLKPDSGSQGRGTLHVSRRPDGSFLVRGRSFRNRPLTARFPGAEAAAGRILQFAGGRRYLIQPYLALHTLDGDAFDIRSLVQKNARGVWQLTGAAVRLGAPGSATSNLHGGGSAHEVQPFLEREFGKERAAGIWDTLKKLSGEIPPALEARCGRLVELGLDFGISRDGRVWILEVNSKPGRSAFSRLPGKRRKEEAIYNPVYYARFLLDRPGRAAGGGQVFRRAAGLRDPRASFPESGGAPGHPTFRRVT
jgi:glutathione synthase/RimK-type ligase-like ATP-grasp enzyme